MQREILFATNNAHKLEEVKAILGDGYRLVTLRERGITEEIPEEEPAPDEDEEMIPDDEEIIPEDETDLIPEEIPSEDEIVIG